MPRPLFLAQRGHRARRRLRRRSAIDGAFNFHAHRRRGRRGAAVGNLEAQASHSTSPARRSSCRIWCATSRCSRLALLSLALTPRAVREANAFNWEPIAEVAKLFAGIFLTIIPVIAMLHAGRAGPLAGVVELVTDSATGEPRRLMYFWMTGLLSAFLDNAPTYLVFFNLAGGDPAGA